MFLSRAFLAISIWVLVVVLCGATPASASINRSNYSRSLHFDEEVTTAITDQEKQQEILSIVNKYRGSIPAELVLAIICREGGEGAFHVNGSKYNPFYRESDGPWAQPDNGDGIMQVTAASGYHEKSGTYSNDLKGYEHAIKDGCAYLTELYNRYKSYLKITLYYNVGSGSLFTYLGKNQGDRQYLSHVATKLSGFVAETYDLQNKDLVRVLNQGQDRVNDYLNNKGLAPRESASYYKTHQEQLDNELDAMIRDLEKQQAILNIVNKYRGSIPAELVLAIICREGGEGAFHVNSSKYNGFYRESDGPWAQPDNGDGIMQVTAASGYHEKSGTYSNDLKGHEHAIKDGCDYLTELNNGYKSYVATTLHYNTGPSSLYIYLVKNQGDRQYLSHIATKLSGFVAETYELQNQDLVRALNQGQDVINDYLNKKNLATTQSVSYYSPYQESLDNDLQDRPVTWENFDFRLIPSVDPNEIDPDPRYSFSFEDNRDEDFTVYHYWLYYPFEPATQDTIERLIEQMPGGRIASTVFGLLFRHKHDIEGVMFIVRKETRIVECVVYSSHGLLGILSKPSSDRVVFDILGGKHSLSPKPPGTPVSRESSGTPVDKIIIDKAWYADKKKTRQEVPDMLDGLDMRGLPQMDRENFFNALEINPSIYRELVKAGEEGIKWVPIYPLINPALHSGIGVPIINPKYPWVKLNEDVVGLTEDELGGIDLRSTKLTYISLDAAPGDGENGFKYVTKAAEGQDAVTVMDLEDVGGRPLTWFLIGLSLPIEKFWVNLNPWESARIVDQDLGKTDAGKMMLEADLRMKRDFCKYENPGESQVGARYWELLDKKQEELVTKCMSEYPGQIGDASNVQFQAVTRHWIVPGQITAYGDGDEIYIAEATLDIYSEPVYEHSTFEMVNQSQSSLSRSCLESLGQASKEYGLYAKELEEELILPLVVEEVNQGDSYSDLRQVYQSLALAQWYKGHFKDESIFSGIINSRSLAGLDSQDVWSPRDIWEEYVKSYSEKEYRYKQETVHRNGNLIITETRIYSGGGVDFSKIASHISLTGEIPPNIRGTITNSMYTSFQIVDNDYYFGDSLYTQSAVANGTKYWIWAISALFILGLIIGVFIFLKRKAGIIRRVRVRSKIPRRL